MKRRTLLTGGAGLAAAAAGGALLWKPGDQGAPHDEYFARLNQVLKNEGPGRPVMIIDSARMNHNIDVISRSVGGEKTYRVVVKSLPCVDLLQHVMTRSNSSALMVFHQPFLNATARAFPAADVLLGKPMPVAAARTFYREVADKGWAEQHVQWLVDSPERLAQYQALARELGVRMRVNVEIDVGLHRGGVAQLQAFDGMLSTIGQDQAHLVFSGLMGYEPHLTGLAAQLSHPAVQSVLGVYEGFVQRAIAAGYPRERLTLNGAGSHTLPIYERDRTMNDLAAGSGVLKPTDFDTHHLASNQPALFIATPVLKRYDDLKVPGDPLVADLLPWWNPNMRRLYFIYGGYWKARVVSPQGVPEPLYSSTNQSPLTTSESVDLQVDDYVFLRPTQSEHVMLQFGDLLTFDGAHLGSQWPVFNQGRA